MELSLLNIIGAVSSFCLAACAAPQAWKSWQQKSSPGLSATFLLLWLGGELTGIWYTFLAHGGDFWLLVNYGWNVLFIGVILWFWWKPGKAG